MNTRQCPFAGCGRLIDPKFFACGRHWSQMSGEDQARVYKCYGEWQSGAIDGDELRQRQQDILGLRGTA